MHNEAARLFPKKALISIAGPVGIGKTTFAEALASRVGYELSFEKVTGNPYLDAFYQDFKRWAFHLQIYFLAERFKEHKRMHVSPHGFVQDRSIYEDTDIFARMHYEEGNMTETDYHTYKSLFEAMVLTPYFNKPDVLIYLYGSLDKIIQRIHDRGREMEKQTPVSYWEKMVERYDEWITNFNQCPVIKVHIDDYDLKNEPQSLEPILSDIASVLKTKQTV
ncbi:deoxynucleoside kinase [Tuberibacillus calidus]|uniref:deoxynucleoside kinase n=1 Tax=Tuberibacillus calidus TaxID=340097 RepID=UPI0004069C39|nr:deoxynucleoside kinase [Tuberibacillus calidus]